MALVLADRVQETTTTTGTGSVTLLGAATGYQSFAAIGNGNTTYYCIADQSGSDWEVGLGTYSTSGPTLARTTVIASSNGGSLVSFPSGIKNVFCTLPAEDAVYLSGGNVSALGNVTSGTWQGTTVGTSYGGTGLTSFTSGTAIYANSSSTLTSGVLPVTGGGTGVSSITAGSLPYGNGTGALSSVAIGTSGQILTSNGTAPVWSNVSASAVTTFSGGTTGLTPNTATSGAITLNGTLNVANGGTGLTSVTAGYVPYGNGTGALATASGFNFNGTALTAPSVVATETITGNLSAGAFSYGTLSYSDVNIFGSFTSSVNTYNQLVLQNTSNGTAASSDYVVSNNNGTATAYYGDYGINSSGWTGTAGTNSFNAPNMVYLTSTSTDLLIGTTTNNTIRFATNGGADALSISTTGNVTTPNTLTGGNVEASNGVMAMAATVTSNVTIPSGYNVVSVGPWGVASGVSFTLPSGSRQVIL